MSFLQGSPSMETEGENSHRAKAEHSLTPSLANGDETALQGEASMDTRTSPLSIESGEESWENNESDGTGTSRVLGTMQLAVLVFYNVSGGPFGIEPTVRAGGAMYALLGFLVFPFVWSVPECLITAELGSAYPEASGGVAWIEEAFGTAAGWIAGYLTWLSGATDNAIYPVLFLEYLLQVMYGDSEIKMDRLTRFVVLSSASVGLAYINWLGLKVVGNMSIVICVLSMSPFVILCVWGSFKVDPSRWFQAPMSSTDLEDDGKGFFNPIWGGVLLRPYLNNLFWNLNSFDSAACFAGEVQDPGKTFPHAMFLGVIGVISCYFLPLLIAIGASENVSQADWEDGYLATVVSNVVSPWVGAWTVFCGGISNLALFQAEMSSDAFQIMGMADRGMLPKVFSTRSRHGTPTYGILLGTVVLVVMSVADFSDLVEMLNFNYSISLIMEFAAFIKLRVFKADVPRPYRVPLNTAGCIVMLLPTTCLTTFVMLMASIKTYVYAGVGLAVAALLYTAHTWPTRLRQGGYSFVSTNSGSRSTDNTAELVAGAVMT